MTVARPLYVGIDLGTTNSAAAVFDGERLDLVRNAQGASITPSVVRIDPRGNVVVGARAARMAEQDPDNVRREFKRLMGTTHTLPFPASKQTKRPEELSAAVLSAIREDIRAQVGVVPAVAVVSVPALFELPQSASTSDAARLAGFERVEMIQEPVASAIAAGWKAEESAGPWLVYDLGGGTFDVSLLETQEGLLRVVGHDGDNFLGGRDIDAAIVDWALSELARGQAGRDGVLVRRANPDHGLALRRLRIAAEEAKIELTRAREAEISIAALTVGDEKVDVSLVLDRATFERLLDPIVQRTIDVCARLLATHGIDPHRGPHPGGPGGGAGGLARIVLVGGPTAIPYLRDRLSQAIPAPFGEGLDPMTLVAQGAALYAASAGLDGRASKGVPTAEQASGARVWLQYPAVSSDTSPFVVGKLVDPADRARVASVVLARADGSWTSTPEPLDAEGTFAIMVSLAPRVANALRIEGHRAEGEVVPLVPSTLTIVHGVTIGDPPLARSVGVALANDHVRTFFERGSPLPMRRTFALRTVEALSPNDPQGALRVPFVQGEFQLAHLCRLVGALEIPARELKAPLPAGSLVDVTIEVDRGGRLAAGARIADTAQAFEHVVHLVAGNVPVEQLGPRLADLDRRMSALHARAVRLGAKAAVEKLGGADGLLVQATRDEEYARGGDLDAAAKVQRLLVDLDAMLAEAEALLAWPELDARSRDRVAWATIWVGRCGTAEERKVLAGAVAALEKAGGAKNAKEAQRQMDVLFSIGHVAYLRSPGAWESELDYAEGLVGTSTDPRQAAKLAEEGRAAARKGDDAALERAVRGLWRLLPGDPEDRALGHGSGLR